MADTSEQVLRKVGDAREDMSSALRALSRPEPDYFDAIHWLAYAIFDINELIFYCNVKRGRRRKCE